MPRHQPLDCNPNWHCKSHSEVCPYVPSTTSTQPVRNSACSPSSPYPRTTPVGQASFSLPSMAGLAGQVRPRKTRSRRSIVRRLPPRHTPPATCIQPTPHPPARTPHTWQEAGVRASPSSPVDVAASRRPKRRPTVPHSDDIDPSVDPVRGVAVPLELEGLASTLEGRACEHLALMQQELVLSKTLFGPAPTDALEALCRSK
ncbi:hypothetical protein C8Q77DRAFT_572789 [Trametes polyzona]|nr:hypothetical protein C8Q77DRAFT_572789 [Trametes polyzona]